MGQQQGMYASAEQAQGNGNGNGNGANLMMMMTDGGGRELAESLDRRQHSMLAMSASDGSLLRTYNSDLGAGVPTALATGFSNARTGAESAANAVSNNAQRKNFGTLYYDGEYVPHTKFHSAGNKAENAWRQYNSVPLPALGSNNLEPVPTTGYHGDETISFTASNQNHVGGFNFAAVEQECNLPMGELTYPEEFRGMSLSPTHSANTQSRASSARPYSRNGF